ncbi:hypothetical protein TREMEDRAFT_64336 [Tremella mesenterica DSM 1558]|uniref:uncharacterized protein n=1 Tax=Tremella mesenterica (strain ATCC 24925 / CBS 8224 / DSM 1558 / NBRC 9311 / NRRL Y-6157 / RJB 2259-6 / UBC 559-6) TaxID=578456 RepID=UPI0003F49FF2|nr:uncharacterized protein TREMEDRAFT_64336 [Tremella mesenterica DSM 1558]EIW67744.1 hypothetical protein TREMEDRAFT_64336 [Tremella mesenterica DSM 1558]
MLGGVSRRRRRMAGVWGSWTKCVEEGWVILAEKIAEVLQRSLIVDRRTEEAVAGLVRRGRERVLGPNELRPGASENQNASPPPLESRERSPPQGVQNPAVQTPFTGVPMQHPAVAGLSSGTKVSYRTPLA